MSKRCASYIHLCSNCGNLWLCRHHNLNPPGPVACFGACHDHLSACGSQTIFMVCLYIQCFDFGLNPLNGPFENKLYKRKHPSPESTEHNEREKGKKKFFSAIIQTLNKVLTAIRNLFVQLNHKTKKHNNS